MPHGRSKLYGLGEVAELGDVAAAAVSPRSAGGPWTGREARQEIDTLRSINAHLVRQIEVLKDREAQALRLADRDGLTGLFNRRRMLELLDSAVSAASQQKQRVGLLFIDLDGFKGVNDDFGHAAGDKLLITVASRIAARARTGDFVCRYGGDEFVVILPRVADLVAARQVARSICNRVALPYRIDGVDVHVTAAIGVSIYPDEAGTAAALMHLADESMYRVKSRVADPVGVLPRVPTPARRRDDKHKRRRMIP
jgi:diguanylate cyclase (GGDEF)-like protein